MGTAIERNAFGSNGDWPVRDSKIREKALKICSYALRGRASAPVAREAFLTAVMTAGLYRGA
jgi:hypothetical protein